MGSLAELYDLNHHQLTGSFHGDMALTYKRILPLLNSEDTSKVNISIRTHKNTERLEQGKAGWWFTETFKGESHVTRY